MTYQRSVLVWMVFSLLIAYQVKLESKEPAHGAFAPLCDAPECLVHMDPLILVYFLSTTKFFTSLKETPKKFANYQIFNELYSIELTLIIFNSYL